MNDLVSWAVTTGIGLAVGLGVLCLILRGAAWHPGRGDPIRAVRTYAMLTALAALLASGTAGLSRLTTAEEMEVFGNGAFPTETVLEGDLNRQVTTSPLPPVPWYEALGTALLPTLGLTVVYVLAQYAWPRQTGAVRRARLGGRRSLDLLPRYLTGVVSAVALGTLGLVALTWTAPAVDARQIDEWWETDDGSGGNHWFEPGTRAGGDVAPWLLLAVALAVAGVVVVLRAIARRPVLSGLHPQDDDLVRRIAVNRALRTVVVMLLGIGVAALNAWTGAQRTLALRQGDDPSGPAWEPWAVAATAAVALAMLCWRPPHLAELGAHTHPTDDAGPGSTIGRERPAAPARPGTARAVLRLRRDAATSAWILAPVALLGAALGMRLNEDAVGGWPLVVAAAPFTVALAVLGLFEVAVRRGHTPGGAPATTGTPSRWAVAALGLAVLLAAVWCVLCLTTVVPQPDLATALAVATSLLAAASLAFARLALRRPPVAYATAAQDAALRTGGANRMLAVGAAGTFAATGAACLAGVQVWHGFTGTAVLGLGMDELPVGLLEARTITLVVLASLALCCLLVPPPRMPRDAEDHQPVPA
jgi:hypothetical protein